MLLYRKEIKRLFKGFCDERFFKRTLGGNPYQVLVGTGGGKTYQAAMKLIIESIIFDKIVIFTTKDNTMLRDIQAEVAKILKNNCEDTLLMRELLKDTGFVFTKLFIKTVTASTNLKRTELPYYKSYATNHSYFYPDGHKAGVNPKMRDIVDYLNESGKDVVVIIDEFEDFERKGMEKIDLNRWLKKTKGMNNESTKKVTNNAFTAKAGTKEDHSPFDWAERCNKQGSSKDEKNGVSKYNINRDGAYCLEDELKKYTACEFAHKEDHGRKYATTINGEKEFRFSHVGIYHTVKLNTEQLKREIDTELEGEFKNFERLLLDADIVSAAQDSMYIWEHTDLIDESEAIKTRIDSPEDFNRWATDNKITIEEYKTIKHQVETELGNRLFNKKLVLKQKSCLHELKKCTKYYLSASAAICSDAPIHDELKYKSVDNIRKMNYIWLPRKQGDNGLIFSLVKVLNDLEKSKDIKPLLFTNERQPLKSFWSEQKKIAECRRCNFVLAEDSEDEVCGQNTDPTIESVLAKWITATYLNGTESQGRNYSNTELLIVNVRPRINFIGRLYGNPETKEMECENIQDASFRRLIQAVGRVDRADRTKKDVEKFIIFVGGDDESKLNYDDELIQRIISEKSKYPYEIDYNIYKNAAVPKKKSTGHNEGTLKLLDYVFKVLGNANRGEGNEIPNIFEDGRKESAKVNAVKYNKEDIVKLYNDAQDEYLKDNPNKDKLSLRAASEILGIPKDTISRAVKKS
jgi:hypothetical protein